MTLTQKSQITSGNDEQIERLKAAVRAARQRVIKVPVEPTGADLEFTLQVPGCFDIKCAVLRSRADYGPMAASMYATRDLFLRSLTGWSGVRASHFGAESSEPVPFQRDLVDDLLDALPDVADQALSAFDEFLSVELAKLDASRGTTSGGVSSVVAGAAG